MTTCPLCSTIAPAAADATPGVNASWVCTRCGQRWDPVRLGTVTAYARFMEARA